MSTGLYDLGREGFLTGDISWRDDNIRAILVDAADYTVNFATHDFLDDVPAGARVSTSGNMSSKTYAAGVADAEDVTFVAVTGDQFEAIILYQHTGVEGTSRLIAYIDNASGLPMTPNGVDIKVTWDNGSNKIFKL